MYVVQKAMQKNLEKSGKFEKNSVTASYHQMHLHGLYLEKKVLFIDHTHIGTKIHN